ncbi:autorepressor SdpR family transcription factor [Tepidibacillus decaturensis]|uniref:ArsR family transcriptional regulator n=1 Tax=Tepidibacillus decaturensis TaxID=1413211 RepID=A0A135L282_9BACI|nr:autorepressor SdpR family transcription factor [Tepidibacillus decaturensis]KXG43121.1 ArsR family transcriptional regulator [Tepidibacillus decaturensis]
MSSFNHTFKALSDPTRRKIIQLLKEKPLTAGEIADQFAMTKPSISHHLNILKQADMIQDEKQGQFILYQLNTTVFQDIMSWMIDLTDQKIKE